MANGSKRILGNNGDQFFVLLEWAWPILGDDGEPIKDPDTGGKKTEQIPTLVGSEAAFGICKSMIWSLIRGRSVRGYFAPDSVVRYLSEDIDGHAWAILADLWAKRLEVDRVSFGVTLLYYIRENCSPIVKGTVRDKDGNRKPHKFRSFADAEAYSDKMVHNWDSVFGRCESAERIEKIRSTLTESESDLLDAIFWGQQMGESYQTIAEKSGFKSHKTISNKMVEIRKKVSAI